MPTKTSDTHQVRKRIKLSVHVKSAARRPLSFLALIVGIAALIFLTLSEDIAPRPENSSDKGMLRVLSKDYWYEVALSRPHDHAQHVAIVTIGNDMPTIFGQQNSSSKTHKNLDQACRNRLYEADLLKSLSLLHPKTIVVDMWIDPRFCTNDSVSSASTDALLSEVAKVNVPLVFAIGTYDSAALLKAQPAEFQNVRNRNPPLNSTELVSMPVLHPTRSPTNILTEGVAELNVDNRKIPLSWPVYETFDSVGRRDQLHRLDSLSIAAVRAFDAKSSVLMRLGALSGAGIAIPSTQLHPYTSFLSAEDLPTYRAVDVLCSSPPDMFWKDNCGSLRTSPIGDLSGRAVLIGLVGGSTDIHQTPFGSVPGVLLQANYVESLLDGRVFRPVPFAYQIIIGIVLLHVIFVIPLLFSSSGGALFFLCFASALTALLAFLSISCFKIYPAWLIPLIAGAFVLNITRKIDRVIVRHEEKI